MRDRRHAKNITRLQRPYLLRLNIYLFFFVGEMQEKKTTPAVVKFTIDGIEAGEQKLKKDIIT